MGKFPCFYHILKTEGLISDHDVVEPGLASWVDLERVHDPQYLKNLSAGTLGAKAERKMGLPWSERLVRRSRLAVQGTILAARNALIDSIAANLAGGTHHAFADHGEGFCVLNDVAVAIRLLQQEGMIKRAAVIDVDVHQGNGTAAIFAKDPTTLTFSIHGARNYPFKKENSSLDIELPDGASDVLYLDEINRHLEGFLAKASADILFYLAGVDTVAGDRYGRLSLSRDGLRDRDRAVLLAAQKQNVPVTLLMSGGYAQTAEATADLHAIVHREAAKIFHR